MSSCLWSRPRGLHELSYHPQVAEACAYGATTRWGEGGELGITYICSSRHMTSADRCAMALPQVVGGLLLFVALVLAALVLQTQLYYLVPVIFYSLCKVLSPHSFMLHPECEPSVV